MLFNYSVGFGDICPGELTLAGHIFLICFALSGLGMFCGPIMQITSSWQEDVPGGTTTIGVMALAMGVSVFTLLEGHTEMDALYASIITGECFMNEHVCNGKWKRYKDC